MPCRGVRSVWVLVLTLLLSLLLLTLSRLSALPGVVSWDAVPVNASSSSLLAITFTATPSRCGKGDVFAEREGVKEVESYFIARTVSITRPVSTFPLQPYLSVCSGTKVSSSDSSGKNSAVLKPLVTDAMHDAPSLDLLILVPSAPGSADVRDAIRKSWGSVARGKWPFSRKRWRVALVFLVGVRESPVIDDSRARSPQSLESGGSSQQTSSMAALRNEAATHRDLLVGNFVDSYRNLTLKMLSGLSWLSTHCDMQRVRHLLKADHDMFVHVDMLLHVLEHLLKTHPRHVLDSAVIGEVLCNECVDRNPLSKLRFDSLMYPFSSYPPYVRGGTYLLPGHLVTPLVNASQFFPLLPVEDAYLNGVVARALRLRHVHLQGVMTGLPCRLSPCLFLSTNQLSATNVMPDMMSDIWRAVEAGPQYCDRHTSLWTQLCKFISYFS
jgi:hypothetical protein